MKTKLVMCYSAFIEKLGQKIRSFNNVERLIQTIVRFLNEGAIEVRNMAKRGILNLKNCFET